MASYDLAIIGGGATGMVMAAGLANSQQRIVLLDNSPMTASIPADIAVVMNAASEQIFARVGLASILADAYSLDRCIVSAKGHMGRMRFDKEMLSLTRLGAVLPLSVLYQRLQKYVKDAANIDYIHTATVTDIQQIQGGSDIHYDQNQQQHTISCQLIIACDGAQSMCRDYMDVSVVRDTIDYTAAVLPVSLRQADQHGASQRLLCPGSIAYIPLASDQARIILTLPTPQLQARLALSPEAFMRIIRKELGQLAYTLDAPLGPVRPYPVSMQRATVLATTHGVLAGAAATHLYPITAQGLNLAVRDMGSLHHMISQSEGTWWDADIYNRTRLPDHRSHYQQIRGLLRIFGSAGCVSGTLRSLGLMTAGSLRSVNRLCALHGVGMGVSGFDIGW